MEQSRLLKAHEEKQKEVQIIRHDYEIQLEVLKAKEIALENRYADLARREKEQRESEALLKFKELFSYKFIKIGSEVEANIFILKE